jgi:hypothetical protein
LSEEFSGEELYDEELSGEEFSGEELSGNRCSQIIGRLTAEAQNQDSWVSSKSTRNFLSRE